ncbi:LysR family transcriptional regulator [Rhizosaccharibacter radicis]|uniref:LysR family transcriptional regulator n=1 Tax=Rhizosaccharibacter radicis TaxID=2782605 RepID=A0ABT1VTR9_9PROT|nr:LysR family transcriptional regulator [Acetobacteraceae bacterium KSS12]
MDRFAAMETFVQVVDTGSFSAAARLMRVGQPAVSKTIALLERRLGVALLIRSTHGLAPTEAGQRFLDRARAAVDEAEEAELAARDAGAGLSGRLRISAATTFARLHVLPRLPRFLEENPQLEVDVLLDDHAIDLVLEGIDVALRMGVLPNSAGSARRLASGRRSVVASPAYLARAGEPRSPADLAGHQAVMHSGMAETWSFTRDGAVASVAVSGRLRVSAAEGVRAAVLADIGLAVASDWMFAPELADGTVRRLLEPWSLPPIELWAVFPAGKRTSAKARRFAAFVESAVTGLPGEP